MRIARVLQSLIVVFLALAVGSWAHAKDNDDNRDKANKAAPLTVPVTGTERNGVGSFAGTLTIERFAPTSTGVVAIGLLKGTVTNAAGAKGTIVKNVAWPIVHGNAPGTIGQLTPNTEGTVVAAGFLKVHNTTPVNMMKVQASCDILNLVLGPLNLNLLGLVIDLNQVVLNITGQTGAGNLLGNLLCGITGILDGVGGLGNLLDLARLLNQLLGILGGL
jgi:hypothetical protein